MFCTNNKYNNKTTICVRRNNHYHLLINLRTKSKTKFVNICAIFVISKHLNINNANIILQGLLSQKKVLDTICH